MNTSTNANELPLRDIHLPDPISWWPLAPGWWIIAGIIVFIVIAFFIIRKIYRSKALHRETNFEMERIKNRFIFNSNQYELIQSLSVLLRRSCISYYPRHETASLTGDHWLKYLDSTSPTFASNTSRFFNGVGEIIANAPYMNPSAEIKTDVVELISLCETWLQSQSVKSRKKQSIVSTN